MGNGSSHGKDAHRLEKVPQGARVIGEEAEEKQVTKTPEKQQTTSEAANSTAQKPSK